MGLITAIQTAIRIGQQIYKVQRTFDRKVFFANPTNRFIRKFVPPGYRAKAYRFARYGEISAGAGLIYDQLLTESEDFGIPSSTPSRPDKKRQTRGYLEQSSSRRQFTNQYTSRKRCPVRRQRYRY